MRLLEHPVRDTVRVLREGERALEVLVGEVG
jgi:hypothetical protein